MTSAKYGTCDCNFRAFIPRGLVFFCLVCFVTLTGCFLFRQTAPETRSPKEFVAHYLRSVFEPTMQRDVRDLLTAGARTAIPYSDFVFLRNGEVSHIVGSSPATDTRVSVSVLDQYDFSNDHCVVYALLSIRYPYSLGERETYRLVRLHCRKESDAWAIEPFTHAETGTVILVPTRMSGPLWRLSRDMERITTLVRDEISGYEGEEVPLPGKAAASEREPQPVSDASTRGEHRQDVGIAPPDSLEGGAAPAPPHTRPEKAPRFVPPNVPEAEATKIPPQDAATEKKSNALLSIGKLCYEAGKIDAAAETFRRALALDPDNPVAKDYLSRCENYRLLQKEREEAVRLMEKLLHLDSQKKSGK